VLHIFSPAQKSTHETKRKNYALLLRSKLRITKIEHKCNSFTKHSYNTFNEQRSQRPFSALLIDKTYSPRLAWFLSQAITWFATDRNVQRKKFSMPILVSSGGKVKKFTLQLRYNKLFSFSMLKISSNNSLSNKIR